MPTRCAIRARLWSRRGRTQPSTPAAQIDSPATRWPHSLNQRARPVPPWSIGGPSVHQRAALEALRTAQEPYPLHRSGVRICEALQAAQEALRLHLGWSLVAFCVRPCAQQVQHHCYSSPTHQPPRGHHRATQYHQRQHRRSNQRITGNGHQTTTYASRAGSTRARVPRMWRASPPIDEPMWQT